MKVPHLSCAGNPFIRRGGLGKRGFTLVEMLVSVVILILIMGVIFSITSQTGKLWKSTTGKIGAFEEARIAFETMTRTISQATLNTYYDYARDSSGNPVSYKRQSELHFICGPSSVLIPATLKSWSGQTATAATRPTHSLFFQAPLGFDTTAANISLNRLLDAVGYYIEFNSDSPAHPGFITPYYPPVPLPADELEPIVGESLGL